MVTRQDILTALTTVMDPHMNINVVEMKMIRDVEIDVHGNANIDMVFPCIGCPAWTMIQNDIKEAALEVPGVSDATVRVVWDEPWKKSELSPGVRQQIRSYGYQILPTE